MERRRRLRALLSQVKDDLMRVRLIIERVMMAMMMMMVMMERCLPLSPFIFLRLHNVLLQLSAPVDGANQVAEEVQKVLTRRISLMWQI